MKKHYGRWRYDADRIVLVYVGEEGREQYEVDPDECTTSAKTLDWIAQISRKTWASREDVGYLVEAIRPPARHAGEPVLLWSRQADHRCPRADQEARRLARPRPQSTGGGLTYSAASAGSGIPGSSKMLDARAPHLPAIP
jgi:hypothetical protein